MKLFKSLFLSLALLATGLTVTGCIAIRSREPDRVVTVTNSPGYVVRTLPVGYRTVVVRGTTYYSSGNVYYRAQPGGYVVVERPSRF